MVTCSIFHVIIGITNNGSYMMDNKSFWRYQAFIATPDSDLAATVSAFRGNMASIECGIYLIDVRPVVGIIVNEEGRSCQTLHLYAIDVSHFLADSDYHYLTSTTALMVKVVSIPNGRKVSVIIIMYDHLSVILYPSLSLVGLPSESR
jgi:hypothetical protein